MWKNREDSCRGSFTVEASFVTSFILVVLFFVLRMTFFLTDTVRMEAVLAEGSLCMAEGTDEDGSQMKGTGGFFMLSTSGIQATTGSSKVSASVSQTSGTLLPGQKAAVTVEYSRTVYHPVSFVRQVRSWYSVLEQQE